MITCNIKRFFCIRINTKFSIVESRNVVGIKLFSYCQLSTSICTLYIFTHTLGWSGLESTGWAMHREGGMYITFGFFLWVFAFLWVFGTLIEWVPEFVVGFIWNIVWEWVIWYFGWIKWSNNHLKYYMNRIMFWMCRIVSFESRSFGVYGFFSLCGRGPHRCNFLIKCLYYRHGTNLFCKIYTQFRAPPHR